MSKGFYRTALTGGTSDALDGIDGTDISDQSLAIVALAGILYVFVADIDSGETANPPYIIAPVLNAGDIRWKLLSYAQESGTIFTPFGLVAGFNISKKDDDELYIGAGIIEMNGSVYWLVSDITIPAVCTGSQAYYLYITPGTSYALGISEFSISTTAPTFDKTKGGWYHPSTATARCLATFVSVADATPTDFYPYQPVTLPSASDTYAGIMELATDAETVTGSATDRVTTPANITARLAAPGAIGETTPGTGKFTSVKVTDLDALKPVYTDGEKMFVSGPVNRDAIGTSIDGGGAAIKTGVKGYVIIPYDCTITGWYIVGSPSGSIVIDVWKVAGAIPTVAGTITGTEKPSLSSAQVASDTDLSTWTTAVSAGDVIGFNVDSCSLIERATLVLSITK